MIRNEEYLKLLKSIVSCVSYGDYYSVKELSNLELEKMKEQEKQTQKDLKKMKCKIKHLKDIPLEDWDSSELSILIRNYSNYIVNKIEKTKNIQELQLQSITIEEFIGSLY